MEKEIDILHRQVEDLQAEILSLKQKQHSSMQDSRSHIACEQAALDLQEEMKFRETFIQSLPGFFVAINSEGKTIFINDLMLQALGYNRNEVVGRDYLATLVPESERKKVSRVFQELIHKNEATINENHIIAKNGKELLMEWQGRYVVHENGKVDCFYGVGTNITERKRSEEALREGEARYRTLIENIPQAVLLKDRESRYISINKAYALAFGLLQEEVIGKSDYDFHPKHFADKFRQEDRSVMETGESREFEEESVHNGQKRIYYKVKVPVRDSMGKIIGVLSTLSDITERKQAEEALRALSARQEAILAAVPEIIMEVDCNKVYTWANRFGVEFFGEDVIGKEAAFYFEGEQDTYGIIQPLFNGNDEVFYVESWQRRRDGQKRLLAWRCRVLKDAQGTMTGALAIAHDITDRRRAEEELRESERFLRSTLDGLSDSIALLDEQGKILLVNKAWREFAEKNGISSVSAVSEGSNYLQICDSAYGESSEEAGPFAEGIRDVLSGVKESYVLEYPCHSPDKKRWFVGRITPFPGDGPRRVVVAHEDITERVQAEQLLRKSEERYRIVADYTTLWEYWIAPDDRVLYVSPSCERITGYRSQDFLQNSDLFLAIIHPDDRGMMAAHANKREGLGANIHSMEFRIITRTGELRWIGHSCQSVIDQNGKYLGNRGSNRDITARKQAEENLKETEKKYRELAESLPQVIFEVDSKGNLIYLNKKKKKKKKKKKLYRIFAFWFYPGRFSRGV